MEIIKKNILSIVCGVIVIAAVVAYFVFVTAKMADLATAAKERKSQYDTLNNLLGKQRLMPVTELKPTDPVPLPAFPTLPIIEQAKTVTAKLKGQSQQILQMAVQMNKHEPLVP